ncbi:MAG: phenylalanine--tRNA ligase subunit beta [Caldilineaceae bacterium]|nr:phenylalanine--tRNA ligase subunit beta [Caldilineaceae bacterium]
MLVPLSWLKEYVDITLPTDKLAERLTLAGLEVGSIERPADWWDPETILVGSVVNILPHPDADRLVLVDVDYGGDEVQRVVTGAPNLFAYRDADGLPVLKVAFARAGAYLVDAYSEQRPRPKKKLKPSKIRGVKSAGMVCSELELGLSEEHEGILLLPEDAPAGVPLRDYLGDEIIELELTPDMARCLSMTGVAREVAALTGGALHLPADEWQPAGDDEAGDYFDVRIEEPALCNRYTGILIKGVEIGPSPAWMQQALTAAGMRPINNIVDITNYVMLELGQPLHAFDYDVLAARARRSGSELPVIIVRRAADGEKFTTLDDVTRTLDSTMLMIADTAGNIAIAGVMGGQESEVSATTTNILLEAATFEGINNRRTAGTLRLPSEAGYRFARGVPATLNDIAARRAAELMRRYANGRIVPSMVDAYPVQQQAVTVYTAVSDLRRLLGMDISLADAVDALGRLGFQVDTVGRADLAAGEKATFALQQEPGETLIEAVVPWHRLDVTIPADLCEEVARVIGYEQVGQTLLNDELPVQRRDQMLETEKQARSILTAMGLQEIINHPLSSPENHDKLHPGRESGSEDDYVLITNVMPEKRVMRRTMLVSALENAARNIRFTDRLLTFEIGRVYLPEEGAGLLPAEPRRLSLLMLGPRRPQNFQADAGSSEEMDFFDLKGVVEMLLNRLGFKADKIGFQVRPATETFGPRCAEIFLDGRSLGFMGELHPQVRGAFGLPNVRVNAAELALEPLRKPNWSLEPMQPISSYPPVVEDLAFEVKEDVTVRRIQDAITTAGGDVVQDVELFDVYRGEPLAADAKSVAFHVIYQSPDRSLHEKEVQALRNRIVKAVEQETDGRLRQ